MEIKHQHISIIIILGLILSCGGDKPTTPEQTFPEITYTPGEYYGDALGYVEYLAGNTPIIITVPHDGTLSPSSIADRTYGTMVRDTNSRKVAERFAYFFVQNSGGLYPHIVYSNLHRRKLDPNRDVTEGAQGDLGAIQAYNAYHKFIQTAVDTVEAYFDSGLLLDMHGHAHDIQRIELGYLLSSDDLGQGNVSINSPEYAEKSSITQMASLTPATFSELLRGPTSFGGLLVTKSYSYEDDVYTFDAVPSTATAAPGTDPYFNGGYTTATYSVGKINVIQIEANYDRTRDTARGYGALAAILEETVREFYQEHTGTPIY